MFVLKAVDFVASIMMVSDVVSSNMMVVAYWVVSGGFGTEKQSKHSF